ncbi:hypothetical protein [Pseudovibrio axinellae]|uniref:hypothetical protein n=1 Tax=Pseudovibrio axinellae TaxID=989403 RepID=UPI00111349D0|nr:hypothetical protein [Pseudovibrio axinellae]
MYKTGLVVLLVAALVPVLPRIDYGSRQIYLHGGDLHQVPWVYRPYYGLADMGDDFFEVTASISDLSPIREWTPWPNNREQRLILGKAVDYNRGGGGESPEQTCLREHSTVRCEWKSGPYTYYLRGDVDEMPDDLSELRVQAGRLLDSFSVVQNGSLARHN